MLTNNDRYAFRAKSSRLAGGWKVWNLNTRFSWSLPPHIEHTVESHHEYFALCQWQMFREMEILLRQPLSRRHCLHHCNQALHSGKASMQNASAHHKSAAYCCHKNAPQQDHASAKSRLHCIISLSWNVWTWSEYLLSGPSNKICTETDPGIIRKDMAKTPYQLAAKIE